MIWSGWVLWHINHCGLFNAKSSLYIYIKYIWFVWLGLWHINHCRLFNAKSSLYIYIKYIWFGLVGFHGISTVIIIISYRRHGYPWPSLATSPYGSLPLVGLQGYILYPHIAVECMFELVVLLLPGYMRGSIGVHHFELVLASSAVSCMSGLSNSESFPDGRQVAV